jgi:hypothetical protein
MNLIVDIDGTICTKTDGDYVNAKPYLDRISHFNTLFQNGYSITYWTARGSASGKDHYELTKKQLVEWGVLYTNFLIGKPSYDLWIDDKAINVESYFSK